MRSAKDIRFRVWDPDEQDYTDWGPDDPLIDYEASDKETDNANGCVCVVTPDLSKLVFEQWTGLVDATGQDIYEGDLVRRWRHRPESVQYGAAEDYPADIGQVEYIAEWGRFRLTGPSIPPASHWEADLHDGHSFWSDQSYIRLEVVGNVHQHSRLLQS